MTDGALWQHYVSAAWYTTKSSNFMAGDGDMVSNELVCLSDENRANLCESMRQTYSWGAESLQALVIEYERFMHLKGAARDFEDNMLWPSTHVHNMWRQHLLDTRGYMAFCDAVCGRIVHHNTKMGTGLSSQEISARCRATLAQYVAKFGQILAPSHWTYGRADVDSVVWTSVRAAAGAAKTFHVNFMEMNGTKYTLFDLQSDNTVWDVKCKIEDLFGVTKPATCIHLLFAGKGLPDEDKLVDHNIQLDATVHVILRFRG